MARKNNEDGEINEGLKLLAKSSIIVFVGIFLSKLFTYIYRIIIARHLGPEIYGLLSLAMIILGIFVAIALFGLDEGVLRYVSIYRGKRQQAKIENVFQVSVKTLFFTGIIAGLILFLFSEYISLHIFHNAKLIIFLKVFSLLVPLSIFTGLFLIMIKAFEKVGWYSFVDNILQNFIKLTALILLILLGFRSEAVIFSYFLGVFGMLVASFLVFRYALPKIHWKSKLNRRAKREINKKLFSYSWPIMFFGIISLFLYWIDSFAIGYFKGVSEVGFYNAAVPIAALLLLIPNLFIPLFFPLVTKDFARRKFNVIKELSKQIGKWILILNFPIFLIMILFPGAVINILFGSTYLVAENALRFLSIGTLFFSISMVSHRLISMLGKSKLILINITIAAVINIFLNILLVPKPKIFFLDNSLGLVGASIATMISLIIFSLLFLFQSKKYFSVIPLRRKSFRILLVSIIPTLLLLYTKQFIPVNLFSLLLQGGFFFLLYLLLIFLTGCLDKNDMMILKTLKNKIIK